MRVRFRLVVVADMSAAMIEHWRASSADLTNAVWNSGCRLDRPQKQIELGEQPDPKKVP
jgi:hypothetical protein